MFLLPVFLYLVIVLVLPLVLDPFKHHPSEQVQEREHDCEKKQRVNSCAKRVLVSLSP